MSIILEVIEMGWEHPLGPDRRPSFAGCEVSCPPEQLIDIFSSMRTNERKDKIERMLNNRSYDPCFVLDHLVNPGNVNAIIRTCESFGHAWLHLIEDKGHKKINRTTQGAHHWMETIRWPETVPALMKLKSLGYRLIATGFSARARPMHEMDFSGKHAIVLGNEDIGCKPEVLAMCDEEFFIPSVGMTGSFNVSVAAAIIAHFVFNSRLVDGQHQGNLSQEFKMAARARAYLYSGDFRVTENLLRHYGVLCERKLMPSFSNDK